MSLATGKQFHAFIWTELPINDQIISRVSDQATKQMQLEMTKGYPNVWWIPDIPIIEKDDKTQSEEDEIYSTHEDKHNDDITENGED